MCKRLLPSLQFWLMFNRSFKKRQRLSMIWVPFLTMIAFLVQGITCLCNSTYFGATHFHFPLTFTRFFLWTTRSWRTGDESCPKTWPYATQVSRSVVSPVRRTLYLPRAIDKITKGSLANSWTPQQQHAKVEHQGVEERQED